MEDCIFCKIIRKEVPSEIVYEDNEIIAFKDINPAAPIHILVIPKKHIKSLVDLKKDDEMLVGKIFTVINKVAESEGVNEKGFDGRGNYTLGIKEQLIFSEIEYDNVVKVRGMDIVFVTTAKTDEESYDLLKELGMPFRK